MARRADRERVLKKVRTYAPEMKSSDGIGPLQRKLASALRRASRDVQRAARAVQRARQRGDPARIADALLDYGDALRRNGQRLSRNTRRESEQNDRVLGVYSEAVAHLDGPAGDDRWRRVFHGISVAAKRRRHGERQMNVWIAALAAGIALSLADRADPCGWAESALALAGAYSSQRLGDRDRDQRRALSLIDRALRVLAGENRPELTIRALILRAEVMAGRGRGDRNRNLARAAAELRKAARIASQTDVHAQLVAENWLAETLSQAEDRSSNREALRITKRILAVSRPGSPLWCDAALTRATVLRRDGDEQAVAAYEAISPYIQPEDQRRTLRLKRGLAIAYGNSSVGDADRNAQRAAQAALEASAAAPGELNPSEAARLRVMVAMGHLNRARRARPVGSDEAIAMMRDAAAGLSRKDNPRMWIRIQAAIANALAAGRGDAERREARRIAFRALKLAEKVGLRQLASQLSYAIAKNGISLGGRRRTDDAIRRLRGLTRSAWAHESAIRLARIFGQLGRSFRQRSRRGSRNARLAVHYFALAERTMRRVPDATTRHDIHVAAAMARLACGDHAAALRSLDAARRNADLQIARSRNVLSLLHEREDCAELTAHAAHALFELGRPTAAFARLARHVVRVGPRFARSPPLEPRQVLDAIPHAACLIMIVPSSFGGAAWIVPHGTRRLSSEHVVRLDRVSRRDVRRMLFGPTLNVDSRAGWLGSYLAGRENRVLWRKAISGVLRALWRDVMGPIEAQMRKLGLGPETRALLMPFGQLRLLPLHLASHSPSRGSRARHACRPDGECSFLDHRECTFATTAGVLVAASRNASRHGRTTSAHIVLARNDLPFGALEERSVRACLPHATGAQVSDAGSLRRELGGGDLVHVIGHAQYDYTDPLSSWLGIDARERVSVRDLLESAPIRRGSLIALSGCETALHDGHRFPEDDLGFPSVLIRAGAAAVLGTMWEVDDAGAALLMTRFYEELPHANRPSAALRAAQMWVRALTRDDAVEKLDEMVQRVGSPTTAVREHRDSIAALPPSIQPYDIPTWGAFVCFGS